MSDALNKIMDIAIIGGAVAGFIYLKNTGLKNIFSGLWSGNSDNSGTTFYSQNDGNTSILSTNNQNNSGKTLADYDPYITDGNKILKLIAVVNGNPVYSEQYATPDASKNQFIGYTETTIGQTYEELMQKLSANEGYVGNSEASTTKKTSTSLRDTSAGLDSSAVSVTQPTRDENNMTAWDRRIANNLRAQGKSEAEIKAYLLY